MSLSLRGGQHVIRQPRRLGHEHVDHDDEIERRYGLPHPLTVRERMRGIAGLHEQGAIPPGMIGEDLVGDDIARNQAGEDSGADDGTVCAAPERVEDALTSAVLIVIEAKRFLTRIALRGWMGQRCQEGGGESSPSWGTSFGGWLNSPRVPTL